MRIYYLFFGLYIYLVSIVENKFKMEEKELKYDELYENYQKLKEEYDKLKEEYNQLLNQRNVENSPLDQTLQRHIINKMTGGNPNGGEEFGDALRREMMNNPHLCDHRRFSWNCCFSKDTKITVKKNENIINKKISEIKKDDLILTLINGEKKFTKVKYTREYDDEFEFYEFKCMKGEDVKSITVTNNHIMMAYNENMEQLKYKTAENIIKNEDYFSTIDGLYQVVEIKKYQKKYKYALGVDEGAIIADDILVSCLNMNDVSKNLSLNDLIEKYKVNIL